MDKTTVVDINGRSREIDKEDLWKVEYLEMGVWAVSTIWETFHVDETNMTEIFRLFGKIKNL